VIRALIVADSGAVMRSVTARLCDVPDVEIVAYAHGRSRLEGIVRAARPDLVVIDQMAWVGLALSRIREIRAAHPPAVIVGLAVRADTSWVVDGLRAGAACVVPRDLEPATRGILLHEVMERHADAPDPAELHLEGAA
jgi:DNA-binding NarL/FixJ family response regulator